LPRNESLSQADFILVNPPFNVSDWDSGRLREGKRWKNGSLSLDWKVCGIFGGRFDRENDQMIWITNFIWDIADNPLSRPIEAIA